MYTILHPSCLSSLYGRPCVGDYVRFRYSHLPMAYDAGSKALFICLTYVSPNFHQRSDPVAKGGNASEHGPSRSV